ncbi:MAG: BPSS1780 family membrane protein [Betaproteobacteria bacterium]
MAWRSVPAGHGWTWIAEGWALFMRNPAVWIVIGVVFTLIYVALHFLPVVGAMAALVLTPVFAGGVMLGCRALERRERLAFDHLFAGFRERVGALAGIGALYLGAAIVIALVVGVATGGKLFEVLSGELDPAAVAAAAGTLALAMLIMLALLVPVLMALWFAPCLVLFQGRGAVAAMAESFVACVANTVPFLLYGLILLGLSIVASIPMGLGWLVLGPLTAASIYTGYRDIFVSGEKAPPAPQPG